MSAKTTGRIIGAFILLAFLLYGGGTTLVAAASGTPAALADVADNELQISAGVLLILVNSVVVAGIGVLAFPILRRHHEISALAYLITRAFEAVMLAAGALCLLLLIPLTRATETGAGDPLPLASLAPVAQQANEYAYQFAMIGLGLGSLLFCRVLLRARLVPAPLAVWGLVGYAIVAAGMALDVLGYGLGLILWIPGGIFEVTLGVLLLVKGFPAEQRPERNGVTGQAPTLPRVTH